MLECADFLSQATTKDFWSQANLFCFCGNEYPSGFFSAMMTHLKKKDIFPFPYARVFFEDTDPNLIGANLSQSILGSTSFFWLGDITVSKPNKQEQKLLDFILAYKGPHTLAFFISKGKALPTEGKRTIVVNIDQAVPASAGICAVQAMGVVFDAQKRAAFSSFFNKTKLLSLDAICLLAMHLDVMSLKSLESDPGYLDRLINSPETLTTLAQCFFAKQPAAFFKIWQSMHHQYPEIFWLTFWSEQIWRANSVLCYIEKRQFAEVKRSSFRLPYSFVNGDYKKTSHNELANAYSFLYSLDFSLKTSTSSECLELFFMNFFMGKFAL